MLACSSAKERANGVCAALSGSISCVGFQVHTTTTRGIIALLTAAGALSLATVGAQAKDLAVSAQAAESAASFTMPAGDFRTEADAAAAGALNQAPRLSPTPAAELMRIKKTARAVGAAEAAAVDEAAPQAGRALFKECVT